MGVDRYANTEVVKETSTGKRNYMTTIFPVIPVADSDVYIITRDGDRLDSLAHRVYGDSTLWWVIASANGISDSFFITPGTKLRVPTDIQFALSYVRTINDTR